MRKTISLLAIAILASACATPPPAPVSNKQKGMGEYETDNKKCAAIAKRYENNLWLQNVDVQDIPRLKMNTFNGCMQSRGYVGGDIYVESKGPERDFD